MQLSSSWHNNSPAPCWDTSPVFSLYVLGGRAAGWGGGTQSRVPGWCSRATSWFPLACLFWGGGVGAGWCGQTHEQDKRHYWPHRPELLAKWSHITSDCTECPTLNSGQTVICRLQSLLFFETHLCQSANTLGLVVIAASHLHCSVRVFFSTLAGSHLQAKMMDFGKQSGKHAATLMSARPTETRLPVRTKAAQSSRERRLSPLNQMSILLTDVMTV